MTTIAEHIQNEIKAINEGHLYYLARQEEIRIEVAKEMSGMTSEMRAAHAAGYILSAKYEEGQALALLAEDKPAEGMAAWKRAEALFARASAASLLLS